MQITKRDQSQLIFTNSARRCIGAFNFQHQHLTLLFSNQLISQKLYSTKLYKNQMSLTDSTVPSHPSFPTNIFFQNKNCAKINFIIKNNLLESKTSSEDTSSMQKVFMMEKQIQYQVYKQLVLLRNPLENYI